jgi:hypothetical protein
VIVGISGPLYGAATLKHHLPLLLSSQHLCTAFATPSASLYKTIQWTWHEALLWG